MQQLQYIVIGDPASPSFSFEGDEILGTSGDFSVDMIGAELCTDVMEVELSYDDTDGALRALPWATPAYFYRGGNLEGKLYSVSVTRIGKKTYRLRTTSAAGIMEYDQFYGGMYAGETFKTVVEWIIGSNGLQPFNGVYRHLIKEYTSNSLLSGTGLGKYYDAAKTEESNIGAFLTATMASKLSAKLKINRFYATKAGYLFLSGTTYRSYLIGSCAAADASNDIKKYRYGLYMQMTRASDSDPFPEFGEVFFVYGLTEISLGTPSSSDDAVYEIDVDPSMGTAVINGTTYSITLDSALADDPCPLHVYGGGAGIRESGSRIVASSSTHFCEHEVFYYTVKSAAGDLQADYYMVRNTYTSALGAYDCVSHVRKDGYANAVVIVDDLQPYNASIYGEYPLFSNRTDFQTDVLSRLSYADGIDTIPIYGWLPICSKREALQQLLFATGVILIKDEEGTILFTAPSAQSTEDIDEDAIYDEGSEDQPDHINTVELTEHSYTLNTASDPETIYESDAGSSSEFYIAVYSKLPASRTGANGLTVLYSNYNAAVVSGTGTITGRPYAHTETVLRQEIASFPDGHGVNVPDATLVTMLNSETVMDRLTAYYSAARKTHVDVAMDGQRCGLMYSLTSAFGESFSGFLVRASKVITSIVRSACEFIRGYAPPSIGSTYANYVILTGSGTWTVPASVFEKETPRIHVVLIGGGDGGDGGFAGANGEKPARGSMSTSTAEGGACGDSGNGGKIFEITITSPAASYDYVCGQGGAGGGTSTSHTVNNPGSAGGNTTISGGGQDYSSANGTSSENGITNSITGERYASRMIRSWIPERAAKSNGGNGGYFEERSGEIWWYNGKSCQRIIMSNNFTLTWNGGSYGSAITDSGGLFAAGGLGGGGGYGQAGSNGSNATKSGSTYRGGDGGKGGDATETPSKATSFNPKYYGYGGLGGGGGGGGGAGGVVSPYVSSSTGAGGAGGYGGRGGDGGDGCVLIYY